MYIYIPGLSQMNYSSRQIMREYILSRDADRSINSSRIFSFAGRESRIKMLFILQMSMF